MKRKLMLALLASLVTNILFAAGVDWSYIGKKPYEKALIVWTDTGINKMASNYDITVRRDRVLEQLANKNATNTIDNLITLCRKDVFHDEIEIDVADPATTPIRVSHNSFYLFGHTGWGFTLLLNFDSQGRITEYAINEVTSASIQSEAIKETEIKIDDTVLQRGIAAAALEMMRNAEAPHITSHEPEPSLIRDEPVATTRSTEANESEFSKMFVFDITNAVKGFTYHVSASSDLREPFAHCGVDVFAGQDGRLTFEVPIKPEDQAKFYRVTVADEVL